MLRGIIKAVVIDALGNRGAAAVKLDALRRTGKLTVLNLHRVGPDDASAYPALGPELFEHLLRFVTANFDVVTFADAASHVGRKPKLILSFDDGYSNFFDIAMPLMAKYGVRANLNVIPECIEGGRPPINVELADFIGKASASELEALDIPGYAIDRDRPRGALGHAVSMYVPTLTKQAQTDLRAVVDAQVGESLASHASRMMTRDQVVEASTIHEIGAHSYGHASLALEDDMFLREDLRRCREYFSGVLGLPMTIYAVPNGSYRPEQLTTIAEAGIESILLVDERFSDPRAPLQKRFTFHANSHREVVYRAVGAYRWPTSSRNSAISSNR